MSVLRFATISIAALLAVPLAGGCSASSDENVGGAGGGGNVGGGATGGFGTGGTNTGGFGATGTGGFGATGTGGTTSTGGSAGSGTGGTGAETGEDGGATGGSSGTGAVSGSGGTGAGGTGGGSSGTGGGSSGSGGSGTGGGSSGSGGSGTGGFGGGTQGCAGEKVAGWTIGGTCYYMADKTGQQHSAAKAKCAAIGTGWDLCTAAQLCDDAVFTYLGTAGCDCNGGSTACACGSSNNMYIQVKDNPSAPYYIRTKNTPNCDWSGDACTDSVSETCGAALCCK